tara:strand:+ start:161 stop:1552 length:1392 start_codon:yes stop_codon:yes gene_type:complete
MLTESLNKKLCLTIILIGFFYSLINSVLDTLKNDKFFIDYEGVEKHKIIKSDLEHFWSHADLFKKDVEAGKKFLESGGPLERNYLYPKLIAFYFISIGDEIRDSDQKFKLKNFKFGIPIIQSLIFYICLFFFFKKIYKKFDSFVVLVTISFLSIEPSLLQFHSSYWSESLYLSMLLIFFIFFLDLPKKKYKFFLFGIFLGLMFMQRNVSLLLFMPISLYLIIIFKFKAFKPIILLLSGYIIVLGFVGYNNYKKSEIFHFIPDTQRDAHWNYVSHILNSKKLNISIGESEKNKHDEMNKWIVDNNIKLNTRKGIRELGMYKQSYFIESLKGNLFNYFKYHIWKSCQFLILDYTWVKKHYNLDKSIPKYWQQSSFKAGLTYKIIYSFFIYALCLYGFFQMFFLRDFDRKIGFFIILMFLYFVGILGWTGISRYSTTILIFFSIFFGYGVKGLINKTRYMIYGFKN